jgi:hypothetical protein
MRVRSRSDGRASVVLLLNRALGIWSLAGRGSAQRRPGPQAEIDSLVALRDVASAADQRPADEARASGARPIKAPQTCTLDAEVEILAADRGAGGELLQRMAGVDPIEQLAEMNSSR